MFKVVLAGDAAVGKSSIILRLCKDKFVNNLSSTLGKCFVRIYIYIYMCVCVCVCVL